MDTGGQTRVASAKKSWLFIGIIIAVATIAALVIWWGAMATIQQNVQATESQPPAATAQSTATPQLTTEVVINGRANIWDVVFLPTREMLFTERKGVLSIVKNGQPVTLRTIEDISAKGEGGLMGLAVDPKFTENRFIYTCFNSTKGDIRVVRWHVAPDAASLDARTDIVTGISANQSLSSPGRHSGCRVAFGPDSYIWIGTGDAALGDTAIQPKNLGGKILRVDRDGKAAPGNVGGQYDARIFSYGHRNVQALAFFPSSRQGILGINVEHGSNVDDEINLLRPGNFGWAPPAAGYNETGVPMTDTARFPDAIEAVWKSGSPTQAPSGATFVHGEQWKAWNGRLMVAMLKAKHLKVVNLNDQNVLVGEDKVLEDQFGRIRTAAQGPDGNLYISTDNESNNQIIRVTPH